MRKVLPRRIFLTLLLALTGCRANNAASNSAPQPATQPAAANTSQPAPLNLAPSNADDARPVIVCFGDSLTAGAGTDPGQSYPEYLQAALDQRNIHYRVDNQGISGNTTKDGLQRLPEVLALHPAVVLVEFGGNDGLRGLPIADTRANLAQIVATLQHSGAKVALAGITLPPDYGPDYIRQFNATYTVIARKYRVPLLPFLLKDVYGVPGMMQSDRTHATATGNQIVARNLLPLLLPLLKK
jgi:acyl-CoA thioesterase-1